MNRQDQYLQFLSSKIRVAERKGIQVNPDELHGSLRPDQKDTAVWALDLGAALIASDAGMGKTRIGIEVMRILKEKFGGKCLIVTELGAADTFVDQDPEVGEGAAMGIQLQYVTNQAEAMASGSDILVTNYERLRDGNFDLSGFTAIWLDEGNYVKNMASETTNEIQRQLQRVKYKFIATATPSPNETLELINYAHVLGICDRGQILTQFFQRNSQKAGELTLHPQHVDDFWLWVHSWCIAITSPADLGYNYPGFVLPKLRLHWVEVTIDEAIEAGTEKDGQARMFIQSRSGLSEAAKIKRISIPNRVRKAVEITNGFADDHFILWHHLEDERKALNEAFAGREGYGDLFGSQKWEVREKRIVDFTKGNLKYLATKPELSGVGCNFQKHCCKCVFVGINDSFNDIYQALKRIYRFYNPSEFVDIWLLYTPEEYDIVNNLKRKWKEHDERLERSKEMIQTYGLDHSKFIEIKKRSFIQARKEWKGERFTWVNTDCVFEWFDVPDNNFGLINSSFPFGNHYEYTDKYNDFGHNQDLNSFRKQLDFLIPELYRSLQPGRIAAIHLKNRIHYGSVTGYGFSVFHRFTHAICDEMEKHGFHTMGFHYIPTDVVAENNQTYRLGYGEMCKDSTKMGSGIPEEIWLFRKPPTSTANSYADVPVTKNQTACPFCGHVANVKEFIREGGIMADCPDCDQFISLEELIISEETSLAAWQIDADSFWQTSGNRMITPQQMKQWGLDKIQAWWKRFNRETIYDYDGHVELLQALDEADKLSRTFTTLPMQSDTGFIWNDVNRMHGMNLLQSRRNQQNHICPQPFDEVRRVIRLYSNKGDLVGDPFGGLGTTPKVAVEEDRRGFATELSHIYSKAGALYLKETELKKAVPTLFDAMEESVIRCK